MIVEWKRAYRIGDCEIDSQHQTLFNKANAFMASLDSPMLSACAAGFYEYMCEHFEHEETLMRNLGYPAFDVHAHQHHELLSALTEILADVAHAQLSKTKLELFLTEWFVTHMRTYDMPVALYLKTG